MSRPAATPWRSLPLLSLLLAGQAALAAPALAAEPVTPIAEMDLSEAMRRFHESAPTEWQIKGRVAEARAQVRLATAPLQPILAAQGAYTRNDAEVKLSFSDLIDTLFSSFPESVTSGIDLSQLPDDLTIQPLHQLTVGASLQVPLLAPAAWADLRTAKAAAHATELSAEAMRQQAEAALVKTSWMSEAAEELLAAAHRATGAAAAHLESAKKRQDAGLDTALDVLIAQTELSRRQSEEAQAVADLDRARRAVGALMGLTGPVRVSLPDPAPTNLSGADAEQKAYVDRPDLLAAAAMEEVTHRAEAAARWRHAPTLAASGLISASDVPFPTGENTAWKVGLNLTWVLYDGGARYGLVDRAQAQGVSAQGAFQQAQIDASRQAQDAVEAVSVARARLRLAEDGLATAAAAEDTANRLYAAGLAGNLDVIDAAQRRLSADVAHAAALAQVGIAQADLAVATGQGWAAAP